jgi:MOSC domain-containing protein YiiM
VYRYKENENMETVGNLLLRELEAGLETIRQAPNDNGILRMIVRRPGVDEREVLEEGELSIQEGLVGDTWKVRTSRHAPDGSTNTDAQITLMNARATALLAQSEDRWPLAGDQLYVDMNLAEDNLPPGTRLALGSAVIEVTDEPHTGCKKFAMRYGTDATKFVNSREGKRLHLRGINTKVIQSGTIRVGDVVKKL